jgi:hypothetical protein
MDINEHVGIGAAENERRTCLLQNSNQWERWLAIQVDVNNGTVPFCVSHRGEGLVIAEGDFADRATEHGEHVADAPSLEHFVFDNEKFVSREWSRLMPTHAQLP